MYEWVKFFHLGAGIVWLGGMALMILALRPVLLDRLLPPERLPLTTAVLSRFFKMVWLSIAVLFISGLWIISGSDMRLAPRGWHVMTGIGSLMFLIFAHIWFAPFRRLKASVLSADWSNAGKALGQIHFLVLTNFSLGWLAVAAVIIWR